MSKKIPCTNLCVNYGYKYKISSEENNVDNIEVEGNDNNHNYSDNGDLNSSPLGRRDFMRFTCYELFQSAFLKNHHQSSSSSST